MYKGRKILALIPARSESKRLPGKNIKMLAKRPLIAWTIEHAMLSDYVDKIVVSTDDRKIADISERYGAEAPFLRPRKLATDKATSIDVLLHSLDWLKKNKEFYDIVVFLQPTSPLRTGRDIDRAIRLFFSKKAKAVVSVCGVGHSVLWSDTLPKNGCMKDFMKNKQDKHKKYYMLNGAIYLVCVDFMRNNRTFLGAKTFAYMMPRERSIDIDNKVDFLVAESLLKNRKKIL